MKEFMLVDVVLRKFWNDKNILEVVMIKKNVLIGIVEYYYKMFVCVLGRVGFFGWYSGWSKVEVCWYWGYFFEDFICIVFEFKIYV